jgi:hypothetical protein
VEDDRHGTRRWYTHRTWEANADCEGGVLSGIALAQDERIQLDEQRAVLQDIPGEPGVEGGILAGPDPGSVSIDVDPHRQDESLPYDANKGTPSNPSPTFPPQSVTNGGCSTIPR